MKKLEYTVQFVTPAFLGNAEQNGQWRTPPFKALLRQWWRILNAREAGYNANTLRQWEGDIFGSAADNTGRQSKIKLRLASWNTGSMQEWPQDLTVLHKEVKGGMSIGSNLYLGYGPLRAEKGTKLKNNAAIQEGSKTQLSVIFHDGMEIDLTKTLMLAHGFGTLGGRSRNAWGSLNISEQKQWKEIVKSDLVKCITRPLVDCLNQDWPTALGKDEKGVLVWEAKQAFPNWSEAMKELAKIKIGFRVDLGFNSGENAAVEGRHIIAYPVTKHSTRDFDRNARLPNQLRFKVNKTADGKYLPTAFHFPVATPAAVGRSLSVPQQIATWQQVHKKLDELMTRVADEH